METVVCEICENPTFICKCDVSWASFNHLLSTQCLGKTDLLNEVKYTSLSVSTMTICFNFNQDLNLELLNEKIPKSITVIYKPGSKKSKIPKKKRTDAFYNSLEIKITIIDHRTEPITFSNVSVFLFHNGNVKVAGCKTINTINLLINELIMLINYIPGSVESHTTIKANNIKIQMINSNFNIKPIKDEPDGWCLKQEDLKNILVNNGYSATFSSLSRYPGINAKVKSLNDPKKKVTLLIFRSGNIIITGGKYIKDVCNCYALIIDLISQNAKKIFYYDINEEIKQKKKTLKKIK